MKIKLKKLSEDAQFPKKANKGDFCYDIYATSDAEPVYDDDGNLIEGVIKYHTGLAMEIVREDTVITNDENTMYINVPFTNTEELILDIDLRPRSSIYKYGLSLCNSEATVDELYRNEVLVKFYKILPQLPNYVKGDRICQMKVGLTFPIEFEFVDELNMNTERGLGGFGSSDKK